MNQPITLPRELLTLVLTYVNDETLEKARDVNLQFKSLLENESFWKARYLYVFANHNASLVLPETSAHFGWKELYQRVSNFVIPEGKSYVGPTGNVYFYAKPYRETLLLITLPIQKLILLESPDDTTLVVVYLNFDLCLKYSIFHSFVYHSSAIEGDGVNVNFKHHRGLIFGPSVRYHHDSDILVLLTRDGQVFFCYKLSDLVNIKNNITGQTVFGDISVGLVPNTNSSYFSVTSAVPNIPIRRELDINIFYVTYIRNEAQVFHWPRVSAEYFAKLQEEMNRLLPK